MPAFTKATGINVSIDKLPQENLIDKLTVSYAAGNPVYDISMADETWVTGLAPYLAPMDDWIGRDKVDMAQYVPKAAAAGVVNNVRVAMPLDPNVNMLWYRKDLFDAKGVKQPTNFDEIIEAAEKLNDPANNVAGISVAGSKTGGQASALAELLLWNAGGEIVTPDGKFGFDSPAGIKALQTYQRIIKSAPPGVMANGATEELDAFYQGRAAMVFYWASIGPNATDPSKSKGAASVGWAGVPNGMRGVWNMAIPKESKVKDAAWELAKWLSGPEGSLAFTNGGGGHSARYDVLKNPDFQKKFPWAPDLLKALEGCRNRPQLTTWSAIDTAVGDMTTSVLAGQASPEDAIKSATSQVQPYLKS
jgi:multiple sugar transport system substrate-binding protein